MTSTIKDLWSCQIEGHIPVTIKSSLVAIRIRMVSQRHMLNLPRLPSLQTISDTRGPRPFSLRKPKKVESSSTYVLNSKTASDSRIVKEKERVDLQKRW